jgi:hypothetical protein
MYQDAKVVTLCALQFKTVSQDCLCTYFQAGEHEGHGRSDTDSSIRARHGKYSMSWGHLLIDLRLVGFLVGVLPVDPQVLIAP